MVAKKVLLVGQGARENVIAESLKKSDIKLFTFMKAKNPGIKQLANEILIGKLSDFKKLETFIEKHRPDFAVIGPENPLAEGIADFLIEHDIPCIGPTKELAQIESSKSFTRYLMDKYDIPGLPVYKTFEPKTSEEKLRKYIEKIGKVAIKRDGLAGGKGVKLLGEHLENVDEAISYCQEVFKKGEKVVIEELLQGEEFSLQCFVSDEAVIPMPVVQDHKRAYENDEGPNTGGMGSYSTENHSLPFLLPGTISEAQKIIKQTAIALKQETGKNYCGILYGGFMITPQGLKLLEYNARFGDPEAMNVLPLLETPLLEIFEAMINEKLEDVSVEFRKYSTVCKYLAPEGYPVNPNGNQPLKIDDQKIKDLTVRRYYASVKETEDNTIITTTSRAIALVGIEKTIEDAERKAEKAIDYIQGPLFHRKDIGTKELIQKRINNIKELRIYANRSV
jgi:phosphoribosylamine--glycine ligase